MMTRRAGFCVLVALLLTHPAQVRAESSGAEASKQCIYSFTINDSAGRPVPEATLTILRWTGDWNVTDTAVVTDKNGKATVSGPTRDGYFVVRVVADGFAVTMYDVEFSDPTERQVTMTIAPPVIPIVKVVDPDGRPVSDAEIQRMEFVDANKSSVFLTKKTAHGLLQELKPSDKQGNLSLPPVPAGALVTLTIVHPEWTPVELKNLKAKEEVIAAATMKPGVGVQIELVPVEGAPDSLDGLSADVRLSSSGNGSLLHRFTIRGNRLDLTAIPREYHRLSIELADYFVTPYVLNLSDTPQPLLDFSSGESRKIQLNVRPRVTAKGKVVDHRGNPMKGVRLYGSVYAVSDEWPAIDTGSDEMTMAKLRHEWGEGGSATSDAEGNYEIELAAGKAYVETIHAGYFNSPSIMKCVVDADGSSQIPTITMLPVPVLCGRVEGPDGNGVGDVLVRMRSRGFGDADPVDRTDEDGFFELKMSRIPYKRNGNGLSTSVFVVAVDPNSSLAGIAEVEVADRDATESIRVALSPQSSAWVMRPYEDPEGEEAQRSLKDIFDERQMEYPDGVVGKPVPDLSQGTWLNSEASSLADFRGKHVLLDFWFIGCGPCIRDMPSVKLAHELFSDQEFAVVSVHRKGQTPEAVQAYADANHMEYPIVVDDAEGSITEQYRSLGVRGYPSYILIDPNGKIIHNDNTTMPPSLRNYKLERVYQALHP